MAWCTLAKVCVLAMLVGVALVSAADHKKRGGHHPHGGHHARGHPARGHPARGHPARGHPARGHPARGHPARGHPARGHPARGHVARRPAAKGHLAHAHTAAAHPAVSGAMRARATSYGTPGKSYPGGSGTGVTTRYWDCCKPTCAWRENAGSVTAPVATCVAGGESAASASEQSGCNGGNSFVCNNQQPFVKNGKAYAWAAANVNGLPTSSLCCACYELTFKDSAAKGQVLTVQVSNTGSDLGNNHFDLQIPGGGFGIFTAGCPKQWPSTPATNWGKQYGGVDNKGQCNDLPDKLRGGCDFRFDWFKAANNPNVDFVRVACPTELTSISKCKRNDD